MFMNSVKNILCLLPSKSVCLLFIIEEARLVSNLSLRPGLHGYVFRSFHFQIDLFWIAYLNLCAWKNIVEVNE